MRAVSLRMIRRAAALVAERARQVTRSLPAPLSMRVRDVAEWVDRLRPAAPIEDWSRPLIQAHSGPAVSGKVIDRTSHDGGWTRRGRALAVASSDR